MLAKNFDTTPPKEVIGEEPIRAPVSDVIGHLVKRGHNDPRVSQFAQGYLYSLENHKSLVEHSSIGGEEHRKGFFWWGIGGWNEVGISEMDFVKGLELLNKILYASMIEKTANIPIPAHALLLLAAVRMEGMGRVFGRYVGMGRGGLNYLTKGAERFGDPNFLEEDNVTRFINGFWSEKNMKGARAIVNMIRELRYTMSVLTEHPIFVDTGQYRPKYQERTYADMENQIANELTNLPNYQAKVKLLTGEHVIQTWRPKERQAGLKTGSVSDEPPPAQA